MISKCCWKTAEKNAYTTRLKLICKTQSNTKTSIYNHDEQARHMRLAKVVIFEYQSFEAYEYAVQLTSLCEHLTSIRMVIYSRTNDNLSCCRKTIVVKTIISLKRRLLAVLNLFFLSDVGCCSSFNYVYKSTHLLLDAELIRWNYSVLPE